MPAGGEGDEGWEASVEIGGRPKSPHSKIFWDSYRVSDDPKDRPASTPQTC